MTLHLETNSIVGQAEEPKHKEETCNENEPQGFAGGHASGGDRPQIGHQSGISQDVAQTGDEEAQGRTGGQTSRFDDCPGEGGSSRASERTDINEYANWTVGFWFSGRGRPEKESVSIMAMGLAGEAGEVVEHLKKFVRDDHINVEELKKELGDSIYYWARICKQFGLEPTEVIQANVEKLVSRRERGKLRGDGDNR